MVKGGDSKSEGCEFGAEYLMDVFNIIFFVKLNNV